MRARLRWIVVVVLLLVGGATLLARTRQEADVPLPVAGARLAPSAAGAPGTSGPPPAAPLAPASSAVAVPPPGPGSQPEPVVDRGYPVNLEAIRAQIPGNGYWRDQGPTNDAEELRRRDADAAAWNVLHGKVLSGTATDPEILGWVDHRRKISEDAIEFARLVLAEHGAELPERDRGLLDLAIDMHRTRLAELPREEAEARARKAEQDRRRAEWQSRPTP